MTLIPESTFAQVRALSESGMPDTFTVHVPGEWVPAEAGGDAGHYAPGSDLVIQCRKGTPAEEEQIIAGQFQAAGTSVLVVPLGSPLDIETKGTYANSRTGETVRYAVKAVRTATYSPHMRLIVAPADTQGA